MAMMDENVFAKVKQILSAMKNPVKLLVFTAEGHEPSSYVWDFAQELARANPLLAAEMHDLVSESALAAQHQVREPGTTCLLSEKKMSLKMLGLPGGHEFLPFLQTILEVSKGGPDMPRDLMDQMKSIDFPVNMKVFVTPTCPYCPGAARLAHMMAMVNPNVSAEVIEANEFPMLSRKYQVSGVPKTVINDVSDVVGAMPPEVVLKKVMETRQLKK